MSEAILTGPGALFPLRRATSAGLAFHGAAPTGASVFYGDSTGEVIDLQLRAAMIATGLAAGDVSIVGGIASFEGEATTYLLNSGITALRGSATPSIALAATIDSYLINYAFKTWKATAGLFAALKRVYFASTSTSAQLDWISAANAVSLQGGTHLNVAVNNAGANILDDTYEVYQSGATGSGWRGYARVVNGAVSQILTSAEGSYTVVPSTLKLMPKGMLPTGSLPTTVPRFSVAVSINTVAKSAGGTGYPVGTHALVFTGGTGTAATGTATVGSDGKVASCAITNPGSYSIPPNTVSLDPSTATSGSGFVGIIEGGVGYYTITSLTIDQAGVGLANGPHALTFSGGTGTAAVGTATVSGGVITSVSLTSGGKYIQTPTEITLPALALAAATDGPIISWRGSYVSGVTIAAAGAGLGNGTHSLTFVGPNPSNGDFAPDAAVVVSGGVASSVILSDPGRIKFSTSLGAPLCILVNPTVCTTAPTFTTGLSGTDLTVAINNAGAALTNGTYPLALTGGTGIGGAAYCTVSGNVVTSVTITAVGVYTGAPTARIAGCPTTVPTFTATIGAIGYTQYRGWWNTQFDAGAYVSLGATASTIWSSQNSAFCGVVLRSLLSQGDASAGSADFLLNGGAGIGVHENGIQFQPQSASLVKSSPLYSAVQPYGGLVWYNRSAAGAYQAGVNGDVATATGTTASNALDSTTNLRFCGNGTTAGQNEIAGVILADSLTAVQIAALYAGLRPWLRYHQITP